MAKASGRPRRLTPEHFLIGWHHQPAPRPDHPQQSIWGSILGVVGPGSGPVAIPRQRNTALVPAARRHRVKACQHGPLGLAAIAFDAAFDHGMNGFDVKLERLELGGSEFARLLGQIA
jgi:hypothetical protein